MNQPEPGAEVTYTDLAGRVVPVRFIRPKDTTVWKVKLLQDSAQLGRKAGEMAYIAARFLSVENKDAS